MRVLILHDEIRRPDIRPLFSGLQQYADVTIAALPKLASERLEESLQQYNAAGFDRVLLALQFRRLVKQRKALAKLNNLVVFEEDACQDRLPHSRWHGRFSRFYKSLPTLRVICTGYGLAQHFRAQGVDAYFLPKGADCSQLDDDGLSRDIGLGFIGVVNDRVYRDRQRLLASLVETRGLQCLRTTGAAEYRRTLNRIRVFVSADIGFSEYMFKNAEAMACGCLLLAYSQGKEEDAAMGLQDGVNVLLYRDENELLRKLDWLSANPDSCDAIRHAGHQLVRSQLDFGVLSARLNDFLQLPLRTPPPRMKPWWQIW
ncbi:MAG TPA: glycosyltransferase [Permianibacter sp.]|nr:glycosyltransferase [Permianibacter sp.]